MNEREMMNTNYFKSEIETEMINISPSTNNDSNNKFNSLIVKEEPLLRPEKNYERRGNCFFFLYTKNGYPLIIIGPHCK